MNQLQHLNSLFLTIQANKQKHAHHLSTAAAAARALAAATLGSRPAGGTSVPNIASNTGA